MEVGIDVAVPPYGVVARMMLAGRGQGHAPRMLRDRDFSLKRKAYYLAVGPLFHVQKWRGVRRGAAP